MNFSYDILRPRITTRHSLTPASRNANFPAGVSRRSENRGYEAALGAPAAGRIRLYRAKLPMNALRFSTMDQVRFRPLPSKDANSVNTG